MTLEERYGRGFAYDLRSMKQLALKVIVEKLELVPKTGTVEFSRISERQKVFTLFYKSDVGISYKTKIKVDPTRFIVQSVSIARDTGLSDKELFWSKAYDVEGDLRMRVFTRKRNRKDS